jgi:hypothetical protein
MTHSFGEGYSTRSDEEGFGGIYGRDDLVIKTGKGKHVNHPGTASDYSFLIFFLLKKSINVSTELNLTVSLCLHVTFIEYDDSQGCEVKEKEKARNQKHGAHTA